MWLRAASEYSSKEHEKFVKNSEQDHINDFKKWWNPTGEAAGKVAYLAQKKIEYDSKEICETKARRIISSKIGDSFRPALRKSQKKWDKSGKHTWNPR